MRATHEAIRDLAEAARLETDPAKKAELVAQLRTKLGDLGDRMQANQEKRLAQAEEHWPTSRTRSSTPRPTAKPCSTSRSSASWPARSPCGPTASRTSPTRKAECPRPRRMGDGHG